MFARSGLLQELLRLLAVVSTIFPALVFELKREAGTRLLALIVWDHTFSRLIQWSCFVPVRFLRNV